MSQDKPKLTCRYCKIDLTETEIKNLIEAEETTVSQILSDPDYEVMCDQCAEGE